MPLEDLKLNKQLLTAMKEEGLEEPTEIQANCMARILAGQDVIAIGPEGCGKSTLLALSTIMQLKYAFEDVPRALILVPSTAAAESLVAEFNRFTTYTDLRVQAVHTNANINTQKEDLYLGVDVVVGTPDRVYALTLRYGLNLNKLKLFVLDDAELLVKQGFQVQIREMIEGLHRCQFIISTTVYHSRLEHLIAKYLNYPTLIEVFPEPEEEEECIDLALFNLPNFKTKLNFLRLLAQQDNTLNKVVVFVNTRLTAGNLYTNLDKLIAGEVGFLHSLLSTQLNFDSVEDFLADEEVRVLIVAHEIDADVDVSEVPQLLIFDLPEEVMSLLGRLTKSATERHAQFFATDLELPIISKIEFEIGEKMKLVGLPSDLIIEGERDKRIESKEEVVGNKAFHAKKEKNAKTHNYNTYDKRKMFGKARKKGRK